MTIFCIENIHSIKQLLLAIDDKIYARKIKCLSNSSIGQHVRHILEFYQCLIKEPHNKFVNYDERCRYTPMENSTQIAVTSCNEIIEYLRQIKNDISLQMEVSFGDDEQRKSQMNTSLFRELAYCLEHSIHHQALIKVALIEMNLAHIINKNFGVAPSTIRHQNNMHENKFQNA